MFRNLLRTLVRYGARAGIFLLAISAGPVFALPMLGSVALGGLGAWYVGKKVDEFVGDGSESPKEARARRREQLLSASQRIGREAAFLRGNWKIDGLPLDMTCDRVSGREAVFGAAGIPGLIRASRSLLGKEEYSFDVPDLETASRLRSFMERSGIEGNVSRSEGEGFTVTAFSLNDVNILAKEAFPRKKVNIEREVVEGRQYLVTGVRSYEEAVQKYQSDPLSAEYVSYYSSVRDTVDGVLQPPLANGTKVDKSMYPDGLPAGSYIVSEEQVSRLSGQLDIPADVDRKNYGTYVSKYFESGTSGVSSEQSERLENGTPEGLSRYFVKDVDGHHVEVRNPNDKSVLFDDALKAYVVLYSEEQVTEFINRGTLPEGTFVSVSAEAPKTKDSAVVLELDLQDERVLNAVHFEPELPASVQVALDGCGVEQDIVSYSCLVDKVRSEGSVGLFLGSEIGEDVIADSRFNGLRFSELEDHLTSDKSLELGYERAMQWSREAAEINSVKIEFDVKNMEMKVMSSVGASSSVKVERYPLSEQQLESLSVRGAVSRQEAKDLLMQLHPDYFKTYSDGNGGSLLEDPLGSFFRGEKPKVKKGVSSTHKATPAKKAEVRQQAKPASSRPRRKTKLGV